MFVIINWNDYSDVSVITKEDGTPTLFESYEEAVDYAKEEVNFNWRVVSLD